MQINTIKLKVKSHFIGWLFPNGNFEECLYGEHSDMAWMYVTDNNWIEEWREARHTTGSNCRYSRDFIIMKKGYILLDCPSQNVNTQYITYNAGRITRRQVDKLLDIFQNDEVAYASIVENFVK